LQLADITEAGLRADADLWAKSAAICGWVRRRDLPRKASLSGYSDDDIDSIVWNLNSTPRKCLGFKTPIEAFASQPGVALEV